IGLTNPAYKLDINGSLNVESDGIRLASSVPSVTTAKLYNDSTTLKWNGSPLAIGGSLSGTERFLPRYTSSNSIGDSAIYQTTGNDIGIGLTNPAAKLDVLGSLKVSGTSTTTNLTISSLSGILKASSGAVSGSATLDDIADGSSYERLATDQVTSGAYIDATTSVKGIASFNSTNFSVASGAVNTIQGISTSATPAFAGLTATGASYLATTSGTNVGIGTATPLALLQVGTSPNAPLVVTADGKVGIGNTAPSGLLHVGSSLSLPYLHVSSATGNVGIGTTASSAYSLYVPGNAYIGAITLNNGQLTFGGDLDMKGNKITNVSNIGIGVSVPLAKLDVRGGINAGTNGTEFSVSTAGAITGVGVNSGSGLIQGTGGLTLSGTTQINTSGTANTTIGNSAGGIITIGASSGSDLALNDAQWSISGAGSGAFTILSSTQGANFATSSGNVGIGTTGPSQKLDVTGDVILGGGFAAGGYGRIFLNQKTARALPTVVMVGADDGTTNELNFGGGTTQGYTVKLINFRTAANDTTITGTTGLSLNSVGLVTIAQNLVVSGTGNTTIAGNVGIGTTSPIGKLQVSGTGNVIFNQSGNIGIGTASPTALLHLRGAGTSTGFALRIADSTPTDRLVVLDKGYVGIGTTNPVYELDVTGSIRATSTIYGNLATGPGGSIGGSVIKDTDADTWVHTELSSDLDKVIIATAGTHKLAVTSDGNVGIGLTNPAAKLEVAGTAHIRGAAGITGLVIDSAGNIGIGVTASSANKLQVAGTAAATAFSGPLIGNADTVTGFAPASGKTLTVNKTMALTAADDTGSYTLPTGTKTLLSTDGSIAGLTGTISSGVLGNSTLYVGTTAIALNRVSAAQSLTGITSIDGSAATVTTAAQPAITSLGTLTALRSIGTIDTLGNVGVGTTATVSLLDVNQKLNVLSGGNVGIGTTSPNYKLQVYGLGKSSAISSDMGYNLTYVVEPSVNTSTATELVATDTGNLGLGVYYYFVSYTTAAGETAVSWMNINGTGITTDANHKQILINLPISTDPKVTGRKLYRCKVNENYGSTYNLATIANNTDATYQDNIADGSLTGVVGTGYSRANTTNYGIMVNGNQAIVVDAKLTTLGVNAFDSITSGGRSIGIGYNAGTQVTSGSEEILIGENSGTSLTTGGSNTVVGVYTMAGNQTGTGNTIMGNRAAQSTGSGSYSGTTLIGFQAGFALTSASSYSTALGYQSGYNLQGANNIFLGAYSGYYETGAYKLIIDSINRGSEALGRSSALIYGVANATPSSQILVLGGGGNVGIGTTSPNALLQVAGTINATSLGSTPLSTSGNLQVTGTGAHYISQGNVGIGTTNPLNKLVISNSAGSDTAGTGHLT
ncbi:MAG: hypothetical protein WC749_13760, partial [Dehalococcoidia bacterium]